MKPQNQDHKNTAPTLRAVGSFNDVLETLSAANPSPQPLPCPLCEGRGAASGQASPDVCPWCSGDGNAQEPATTYRRRTARPGYELTSQDAPARRIKVQRRRTTREAGPYSLRRIDTVPSLTLSGKWLQWCGLTPGTVAHVEVNPCGLVITVASGATTASCVGEPAAGYVRPRPIQPLVLNPNGTTEAVTPLNGTDFKLAQLCALLGCERIDIIRLDESTILVVDDEFLYNGGSYNAAATAVCPSGVGDIYGTALFCHTSQVR